MVLVEKTLQELSEQVLPASLLPVVLPYLLLHLLCPMGLIQNELRDVNFLFLHFLKCKLMLWAHGLEGDAVDRMTSLFWVTLAVNRHLMPKGLDVPALLLAYVAFVPVVP